MARRRNPANRRSAGVQLGSRVVGPSGLTVANPAYSAGRSARAPKPTRRNGAGFRARANYGLAIILAAISLGGCRETHAQDDPRTWTPMVEVTTVQSIQSSQVAFTGIVEARVQSNLGFRVPGKVIQRLVNAGDFVHRGQPLMRIDRTDLELAVAAKNAAVASTKARAIETATDETRYRTLLTAGVASKQSYDQAKAAADTAGAQLRQAEAEAHEANQEASYAVLAADADGVVMETLAEPGQVVSTGQTVLKLAHRGAREAVVNLPETVHPALGSIARATLYDGVGGRSPAYLRQLSDTADPQTRTYEARYVLEGAAANAPLGSTVTVYLPSQEQAAGTEVPLGAVCDLGKGPGVWVVDAADSSISFRPVRIRSIGTERASISAGVRPGERIVALGGQLLRQGEHVQAISYQASAR
jgi:RND family efflux transporter MFP subunit